MTERTPSAHPTDHPITPAASSRRGLIIAIGVFDAVILLLPPLHWLLGTVSPLVAAMLLVGSCVLVTLSLVVVNALDHDGEM